MRNKEKEKNTPRKLPYDRDGRPQIVIIGNGLERMDDQGETESGSVKDAGKDWDALIQMLSKPKEDDTDVDIPFPLKYHLVTADPNAPYPLAAENRKEENSQLGEKIRELPTVTNPPLRRLPELGADHIFSTNYTYSLERAFVSDANMQNKNTRSKYRFNYNRELTKTGRKRLERCYRLYTGYTMQNKDGSPVNLWHIHGECTVPGSIIVGHDGYGRLLSRIVTACGDWHKYRDLKKEKAYAFSSWPELFLFGDVYIIGLGMDTCEFDLWWLIKRKQREDKATGRIYFYTNDTDEEPKRKYRNRDLLLKYMGVIINPDGIEKGEDHSAFYDRALKNIQERIDGNRKCRNKESDTEENESQENIT